MASRGPSERNAPTPSQWRLSVARTIPHQTCTMFTPFACCTPLAEDPGVRHLRYQEGKLRMLTFWRDGLERQLAAVTAAMATLEQQMERDRASAQH
jgi:hypothetical protein